LRALTDVGDRRLYRIEWDQPPGDLVEAVAEADAGLLEAHRNGDWMCRLRFPDQEAVTRFYEDCKERGVSLRVEGPHSLAEAEEASWRRNWGSPGRRSRPGSAAGTSGSSARPCSCRREQLLTTPVIRFCSAVDIRPHYLKQLSSQ